MSLSAAPASLSWSGQTHGTSASTSVTLTADWTGDSIFGVVITGANANQFSSNQVLAGKSSPWNSDFVKSESVVKTGDSAATFNVTYSPVAAGTHNATLEIHYNGIGNASVLSIPLTGTAV